MWNWELKKITINEKRINYGVIWRGLQETNVLIPQMIVAIKIDSWMHYLKLSKIKLIIPKLWINQSFVILSKGM